MYDYCFSVWIRFQKNRERRIFYGVPFALISRNIYSTLFNEVYFKTFSCPPKHKFRRKDTGIIAIFNPLTHKIIFKNKSFIGASFHVFFNTFSCPPKHKFRRKDTGIIAIFNPLTHKIIFKNKSFIGASFHVFFNIHESIPYSSIKEKYFEGLLQFRSGIIGKGMNYFRSEEHTSELQSQFHL